MSEFLYKAIPATFSILDEEERTVEGFFTDDKVDLDGHFIPKAVTQSAIEDFRSWGNVRDMHKEPVGTVVSIGEKAWNHVVVKIVDDKAWNKVKTGVYKGFSIGAKVFETTTVRASSLADSSYTGLPDTVIKAIKHVDRVMRVDSMMLNEISVVDRPINPRARFTVVKSDINDNSSPGQMELLPVLPEVIEAQINLYKGVNNMNEQENTILNDGADATVVQDALEAVPDNSVSEAAQVETPTQVEKTTVAEGLDMSSAVAPFNAEKVFAELAERTAKLEAELTQAVNSVTATISDLGNRLTEALAKITPVQPEVEVSTNSDSNESTNENAAVESEESTEVTKSVGEQSAEDNSDLTENEPIAQEVTKAVSQTPMIVNENSEPISLGALLAAIDNKISTTVTKSIGEALAKYGAEDIRKGVVNKGDGGDESEGEPERPDFEKLSPRQKVRAVAEQIAARQQMTR